MLSTFYLDIKPYYFEITSDVPAVIKNAKELYEERFSFILQKNKFIDYRLSIKFPTLMRRFIRPQVQLTSEGKMPFKPLPLKTAFAMLEWGLNWTIAMHEFQRIIVHAAVLAKGGNAILMPGPPGSGKSTATAYLENNGWRLLSDEMAIISKETLKVTPFVRPICLKNQSIDLCKSLVPSGVFSELAPNTHKGDVSHLAPQAHSLCRNNKDANIVGVVFPTYDENVFLDIYPLDKTSAMLKFTQNAFNYNLLGAESFHTNVKLIENSRQFEVRYSNLAELNRFLSEEFG